VTQSFRFGLQSETEAATGMGGEWRSIGDVFATTGALATEVRAFRGRSEPGSDTTPLPADPRLRALCEIRGKSGSALRAVG